MWCIVLTYPARKSNQGHRMRTLVAWSDETKKPSWEIRGENVRSELNHVRRRFVWEFRNLTRLTFAPWLICVIFPHWTVRRLEVKFVWIVPCVRGQKVVRKVSLQSGQPSGLEQHHVILEDLPTLVYFSGHVIHKFAVVTKSGGGARMVRNKVGCTCVASGRSGFSTWGKSPVQLLDVLSIFILLLHIKPLFLLSVSLG